LVPGTFVVPNAEGDLDTTDLEPERLPEADTLPDAVTLPEAVRLPVAVTLWVPVNELVNVPVTEFEIVFESVPDIEPVPVNVCDSVQ